jgi:protein transport protein SEC20
MPPLPLTFDDATGASIASIQRRQIDLRDFQIPRLRSCSESLTTQQQYAAELREDLEAVTRLIEVRIYGLLAYMRTK